MLYQYHQAVGISSSSVAELTSHKNDLLHDYLQHDSLQTQLHDNIQQQHRQCNKMTEQIIKFVITKLSVLQQIEI